jgi:hypothetical protein
MYNEVGARQLARLAIVLYREDHKVVRLFAYKESFLIIAEI